MSLRPPALRPPALRPPALRRRDLARAFRPVIAISRHSALPELRRRFVGSSRSLAVRVVSLVAGSTLIGTSVNLLAKADYGLPPYDVLSSGLADNLDLTLGQASWSVAAVLFLIAAVLGHRPSPWGIAYIVANGVAIDGIAHLVNAPDGAVGRIGFVVGSVLAMASGINLVLYSGTTGGPFELLMRAGQDRGVSPLKTRTGLDLGVLVGGVALGGAFGPATVFFALVMGFVLRFISQAFSDHQAGRAQRLSNPVS